MYVKVRFMIGDWLSVSLYSGGGRKRSAHLVHVGASSLVALLVLGSDLGEYIMGLAEVLIGGC